MREEMRLAEEKLREDMRLATEQLMARQAASRAVICGLLQGYKTRVWLAEHMLMARRVAASSVTQALIRGYAARLNTVVLSKQHSDRAVLVLQPMILGGVLILASHELNPDKA